MFNLLQSSVYALTVPLILHFTLFIKSLCKITKNPTLFTTDFKMQYMYSYMFCLCWGFTAQSTTRSCQAGQLIVVLFLGRLRPSKRLTSTKRGRPRL